ncbi:MAG: 4-hydroxy-3-methylbut-2-enyl diphosphate reductase [Candidatus Aureabacteria bacterium]|nr:4-hydroxy-3-methylbut-2-enyl diphosphate reductase [Candidatus Auribacterota bacterium]
MIKCARSAGFCMGVKRALEIVLDLHRRGISPIYIDGPLIHNPQIISLLEKKGIRALAEGPSPRAGIVVIRAHGVSPERRKVLGGLGLPVHDATCPDVAKVQAIVNRHARQGYKIVIVGDRGHAEVEGLLGFSRGRGTVVSSVADAESLPRSGRVCVVAQTTQDEGLFREIAAVVARRAAECVVCDTICRSTKQRQREAVALSGRVDAMVVVGGRNSANTARLAQLCGAAGGAVYHVETEDELSSVPLLRHARIGVSGWPMIRRGYRGRRPSCRRITARTAVPWSPA